MATNDQPDGVLVTLIQYVLNIGVIVGGIALVAGLLFILVTRAHPKPAAQASEASVVQAQAVPTATRPAPPTEVPAQPTEPPASPTKALAAAGPEALAMGAKLFQSQGCVGCHTIEGVSQGVVGPNLTDIGDEADELAKEAGVADAAAYIRESIVDPNAFIAPKCPSGPCPPGVMPQNFGTALSEPQVDALVQYLLAQKGGG